MPAVRRGSGDWPRRPASSARQPVHDSGADLSGVPPVALDQTDPLRKKTAVNGLWSPLFCVQFAQLDLEIVFVPSKECQCVGHILLGIKLVSLILLQELQPSLVDLTVF